MKILTYILLGFLCWACVSCIGPSPTKANFHHYLDDMYGDELALVLEGELSDTLFEEYIVLDTRAEEEYRISHIPGAKRIGYRDFKEEVLDELPKDAPILVYCSVGYRSERIGLKLKDMGFQSVFNLYGGIFEWNNRGRLMHNQRELPTDSIHTYNRKWGKWVFRGIKVY